jgi:hypothetical protein
MKTSKPGFGAISGYPTLDEDSQRKLQEGINVLAKMIAQAIWNYAPGENNLPFGADKLSRTGNQNESGPIQLVPKKFGSLTRRNRKPVRDERKRGLQIS